MKNKLIPNLQGPGSERRGLHRSCRRLLKLSVAGSLILSGLTLAGCKKQPAASNSASSQASSAAQPASPATPATTQPAPPESPAAQPASPESSAAQPASPATPAAQPAPPASGTQSTAQQPAAAPAPPPPVYTVPRGTVLAVRVDQTLSAKQNSVGDTFRGGLARPVRVQGVIVLPSRTPVSGTVVAAKGQGRFKGEGVLGIELNRVASQRVSTTAYEATVKGKGKRSAGFIGGGGGGGALIGALAGGGKGALIGGLVGGGAGTAGAAFTGGKDVTIDAEAIVTFTLTRPITITGSVAPTPAAPQ
jgi:hypothetical protein